MVSATLPPSLKSSSTVQVGVCCGLQVTSEHLPDGVRNPEQCISPTQFLFAIPSYRIFSNI
jgi:hypothetical protein